jgi:hypothetical protein
MDDFNLSTLTESRNEYSALLVSKLTPCLIQGMMSIFNEACELCVQNNEDEKYLMTFQNFLGRVTKWNPDIIQKETERIMRESNCNYLEDLLTCVHVTQLKVLTNVRVGSTQKKVTIDIPKLDDFIHRCYIEVARKVYKNVFLFDRTAMPLMRQKNLRELELIVKECVLNVIRDNMPIENILKSYLEEGVEETVDEEKTEVTEVQEQVEDNTTNNDVPQISDLNEDANTSTVHEEEPNTNTSNQEQNMKVDETQNIIINTQTQNGVLQFNNTDEVKNYNNNENVGTIQTLPVISVEAPKDINRLEEISEIRNQQRKEEDDEYDEDDNDSVLQIHDNGNDDIQLDFEKISTNKIKLNDDNLLGDIEVLQ